MFYESAYGSHIERQEKVKFSNRPSFIKITADSQAAIESVARIQLFYVSLLHIWANNAFRVRNCDFNHIL